MQIFARAFGHARERRTETLGEFLRERRRGRPPDDDEVMAQPEQGPRQRSGSGSATRLIVRSPLASAAIAWKAARARPASCCMRVVSATSSFA